MSYSQRFFGKANDLVLLQWGGGGKWNGNSLK